MHIYFSKLASLSIRGKLGEYKGIDLLSAGKLVVAPGSTHPQTGHAYVFDDLTPHIGGRCSLRR